MRRTVSLRDWIGGLGLAAAVFGVCMLWRATTFHDLALAHGTMADLGVRISEKGQPEALLSSRQVSYHRGLEQKYLRASARPWWPVSRNSREP